MVSLLWDDPSGIRPSCPAARMSSLAELKTRLCEKERLCCKHRVNDHQLSDAAISLAVLKITTLDFRACGSNRNVAAAPTRVSLELPVLSWRCFDPHFQTSKIELRPSNCLIPLNWTEATSTPELAKNTT